MGQIVSDDKSKLTNTHFSIGIPWHAFIKIRNTKKI